MCAPWVNLEVPINCVLLEHWNLYIFPFLGGPHKLCIIRTFMPFLCAPWVNLEVPINCVLLEHWNLEVPINCVLLEHWNLYIIFPFLGSLCYG